VGVGPMMVSMGRVMGSMGSISRQGAYGTRRLSRHLITTTRMHVRLLADADGSRARPRPVATARARRTILPRS
jgi:hypothetical protein